MLYLFGEDAKLDVGSWSSPSKLRTRFTLPVWAIAPSSTALWVLLQQEYKKNEN